MSSAASCADHVLERAVRDGDTVADAGGLQRFSLAEHAVKVGGARGREPDPQQLRQRLQERRLWFSRLCRRRATRTRSARKNIGQNHGPWPLVLAAPLVFDRSRRRLISAAARQTDRRWSPPRFLATLAPLPLRIWRSSLSIT